MKSRLIGGALLTLALTACGGGGGDGGDDDAAPTPGVAADAAGFFQGMTADGGFFEALLFEDGNLYTVVRTEEDDDESLLVGTATARNGSFTSIDARIYRPDGMQPVTVSGTYRTRESLQGSATYTAPAGSVTFTGEYVDGYEDTATLASIVGTYEGDSRSALFDENAQVIIASDGKLTGTGESGCTFNGRVTPKAVGNAFDVEYTFGDSPCAAARQTFKGVAVSNGGSAFTAITVTDNRQYATIYWGNRQEVR